MNSPQNILKRKITLVIILGLFAASSASAAIIAPQTGGGAPIDPAGGEDVDTLATGSATLASFEALADRFTQINWSGVSGTTGNTIDTDNVDVRIKHVTSFAATASEQQSYNTSIVGSGASGYQWTHPGGLLQIEILFGTADAVTPTIFTNDRAVKSAGLVLLNFGGAYPDATIKYLDAADNVLSEQSFSGGGDGDLTGNGTDAFTGYTSTEFNIAKVTIDITRDPGSSGIAIDSLTMVPSPPPPPPNFTVTLEQSSDLSNWSPSAPGDYLITEGEPLFFRARIEPIAAP
jgi:hypothetical protein